MKIGNVTVQNGIFLAPMAGVTESPFRAIAASFGAECVVTEMVSAKAVCYGDKKTAHLANLEHDKRPAGIQIFGSEPYFMASAAEKLLAFLPDFLDINMGCPVKKVVSSGDGCALMRTPRKCGELVKAVKSAVGEQTPVTLKIRLGLDKDHITAGETAKYCEEAGAAAVFVHGRTRDMMYSGRADLFEIQKVKTAVRIPVIGNGDVQTGKDAREMLEKTGCDGIMIGRGALGKPWVFAEIKAALTGETAASLSLWEKGEVIRTHIRLQKDRNGEALLALRKHLSWYTKGIPGSAALRNKINAAGGEAEFLEIVKSVFGGPSFV